MFQKRDSAVLLMTTDRGSVLVYEVPGIHNSSSAAAECIKTGGVYCCVY